MFVGNSEFVVGVECSIGKSRSRIKEVLCTFVVLPEKDSIVPIPRGNALFFLLHSTKKKMSQGEKEFGIDRERADEKSFLAFPVMPVDFWKNDKIHSNNNTKILICEF